MKTVNGNRSRHKMTIRPTENMQRSIISFLYARAAYSDTSIWHAIMVALHIEQFSSAIHIAARCEVGGLMPMLHLLRFVVDLL